MHYAKYDFSGNTLPTIEPLQANVKIGQRYKLSPTDIRQVQLFYSCLSTGTTLPPTTTPTTPGNKILHTTTTVQKSRMTYF